MTKKFIGTHWGYFKSIYCTHEIKNKKTLFNYWEKDPDPSKFGLNFLSAAKDSLRIRQPHIRKGWLEKNKSLRGNDTYIPISWEHCCNFICRKRIKKNKTKIW